MTESLLNAVHTGDARELAARLPDESIHLCLTDPVWERIDDYLWLATECERVLVPGGNLIVQCGSLKRYECEVAMRQSHLAFVDLVAEVYPYGLTVLFNIRVTVGWKPHLWFSKGSWRAFGDKEKEYLLNRVDTRGKRRASTSKDLHPWGDSEEFAAGFIGKLCGPQSVVWDPFTGSGTVPAAARKKGISFVAFEIEPEVAAAARERVVSIEGPVAYGQRRMQFEDTGNGTL